MAEPVVIARLKLSESPKLRKIFKQAVATDFSYFPDHYQQQVLSQNSLLKLAASTFKSRRLILGAKQGKQIGGFLIGSLPQDRLAQIYWLYVAPSLRGQRIGDGLLYHCLHVFNANGARKVALATHQHHEYYAKRGFKLSHHQEQFPKVNMSIMTLELNAD